jgi:parallel beta-helix repeat protein
LTTVSGNCITESAQEGIAIADCKDITLMGNTVDVYGTKPKENESFEGIKTTNSPHCQLIGNIVRTTN